MFMCISFITFCLRTSYLVKLSESFSAEVTLKGYCTVFQHALKSLEITAIVLSLRMSKTARKNSKGLISYKEFKF